MERKMRRIKQMLSFEEVERILRIGKYAVMALSGDDNYPYALPINYVYDGKRIYIHCASQGHKIDSIKRNRKCSMCVVEKDDVVPEEFTSYFRSVIAFGEAKIVSSLDERIEALKLLCAKYSPGIDPKTEIERFIKMVCIIRIDIDTVSGKEAIELTRQSNMGLQTVFLDEA